MTGEIAAAPRFTERAAQLEGKLDRDLAALRARQDAGDVSTRQGADLRVSILSEHLACLAALRVEHFGGDYDPATGWNSGTSGAAADSLLVTDDLAEGEPPSLWPCTGRGGAIHRQLLRVFSGRTVRLLDARYNPPR